MRLPQPRGPLSARVVAAVRDREADDGLRHGQHASTATVDPDVDVLADEDFQLALWILYELHYRGFEDEAADREWDPQLLALRGRLERAFEDRLRRETSEHVAAALEATDDLVDEIMFLVGSVDGPNLAAFLQREATREQVVEFMVQRSVYHLKESDPHSFVLPRVDGRTKVALAELQYDEYGGGRPERLHAALFGDALEQCGLDRGYGAYVDHAAVETLAVNNAMSLFGLHRRLRGAALGHLTAFEVTSSVPCRRVASGIERVGLPPAVAAYFHEHVEADAVHEQVAMRDICGSLVQEHPQLRADVLFGVAVCLHLDALAAVGLMDGWRRRPTGVAAAERAAS